MGHSADFFKDEVRNGFYVTTAIKQAWAAVLDVLCEIERICKKYDIKYFADWGTFLGAVRHGGFIPWDDDLDICMLRDDYIRFREVADKELPKEFSIHDYERKENHWLFLSRVVNNSMMCFDEEYLDKHNNFPWLAGVDIFIKDYLYKDEDKEKARDKEIMNILAIADGIVEGKLNREIAKSHLENLEDKYHLDLVKLLDSNSAKRDVGVALYKLAEKKMGEVDSKDAIKVGQIFPWVLKIGPEMGQDKSFYDSIIRLPFEDVTIPVPAAYNTVLASRYGNYNEIHKVWGGHDYPFFEKQKEEMEELSGERFPGFVFDREMLKRLKADRSNSLKELTSECLKEMEMLLSDALRVLEAGNFDVFTNKISDSQQLAADLGNLICKYKGEENEISVSIIETLQAYCDALWEDYKEIESSILKRSVQTAKKEILVKSEKALRNLEEKIKSDILERKEILFLPIGPEEWKSMEPVKNKYKHDEKVDITVVPLPLIKKNFFGKILMTDDEIIKATKIEEYPKDLICVSWIDYDISFQCPDTVYVQFPYDESNPCLTCPPAYYSRILRKFCDNIVYIPAFKTGEIEKEDSSDLYNLKYYACSPAVVYSDKVVVQSEKIKKRYIEALSVFADENSVDIWNEKIVLEEDFLGLPTKRSSDTNERKKKILFCLGANEMAEKKDELLNSLNSKISVFEEAKESVDLSLILYPADRNEWKAVDENLANSIFELLDYAGSKGVFSVDSSKPTKADELADCFDAYYGSPSPYLCAFRIKKKPAMIANYALD